jgi:hypothetical protein
VWEQRRYDASEFPLEDIHALNLARQQAFQRRSEVDRAPFSVLRNPSVKAQSTRLARERLVPALLAGFDGIEGLFAYTLSCACAEVRERVPRTKALPRGCPGPRGEPRWSAVGALTPCGMVSRK